MPEQRNRNIQLQSFILGGVEIDDHGEGVSPRIVFSVPSEVISTIGADIVGIKSNQNGVMTVGMREEESAFAQMMELYQIWKASAGLPAASRPSLEGILYNAETGRRIIWDKAAFTGVPDATAGETSEVVTFTLHLTNCRNAV